MNTPFKVLILEDLATDTDLLIERLRAAGFDGYVEKPSRYKKFLASVTALPEGRNE